VVLFNLFGLFSSSPATGAAPANRTSRRGHVEELEPRQLLAADGLAPEVLLGSVYFEEATGDDSEADTIQVSFEGGPVGTTLDTIVISGDKDGAGLSIGDVFFDTEPGGLGDDFGSVPLTIESTEGFTVTNVAVADGGTSIVFDLQGFEAGELFVFSIDVDEIQTVSPIDGEFVENSLVEGAEFEFSSIAGNFSAPGFDDLQLGALYFDFFDGRRADAQSTTELELALPDDAYEATDDKSDRTAGAVAHAALKPLATIAGNVYHDRSDDGVFDRETEEGIGSVPIELLNEAGVVIDSTTTASDGSYMFINLHPGKYTVREAAQPDPYLDGKDAAGSHGGVAGDEIIVGAMLDFGDNAIEYNFGELLRGSIAGRVHAMNGPDCDFDNPDILLAGVTISLLDADGAIIRSTTTGEDGRYKFENLAPGEYQVREGAVPSQYFDGGERAGSAGGDVTDDQISGILLGSSQDAVNYDFCEHVGATLSGFVYHDRSDDGVFDPSEDPIPTVRLKLLKDGVDTNRRAVTNGSGFYQFTNLAPGKYSVMEIQPDDFYDGKDTPGTLGGDASTNDMIAEIMLDFGDNSQRNNFGELLGGSIAGRVHAMNGPDCDFDNPDILLAGVTISLLDSDGNFIRSTTTDAQGRYKFDDLEPGEYQVREDAVPGNYFDGGERAGSAGGAVSDDLITGIEIGSEQDAINYDFCEHVGAMLSGYVYHDRNDDGVRDPSEEPIVGVAIKLLDAAGTVIDTVDTNDDGFYKFNNLDAGKYTVMESQPDAYFDGKDTPGTLGGDASTNDMITMIMLDYGDHAEENNFGELLGASIAGRVHAMNGPDCDFDNPDVLLEGVKIELLNASGEVVATTFTNNAGQYRFVGLRPGEYQVRETQPEDYYDGGERAGDAGGLVADDLVSGILLGSEQDAVNYDFCEHIGATLSGFVYHDRNDDGVKDPGEEPIEGVVLKLLDGDGEDTGRRAMTDSVGYYQFSNLDAGKYTVMENQPSGYYDGKDTPGTTGGNALVNDMIAMIMLDYGDHSQENNFGELLGGSIAGRVHVSTDPNCEPDDDEPPIPDVTVELLNVAGEVIDSTVTNANGEYRFDNLRPGIYSVREVQPADFFNGDNHIGTGGGSYLNRDLVADITVGSDQHFVNYDFCEMPPAQLSGYVFIDGAPIVSLDDLTFEDIIQIRDGQRTADDTPLSGILVELRNGISGDPIFGEEALPGVYADGPIIAFTDANGFYEFTGLPGGVYAVVEHHPDDLIDSLDTPGTLGGFAVNPPIPAGGRVFMQEAIPSPGQQNTINQFRTRFGNDALVRIVVGIGQNSVENNFSEVRQSPFIVPPETPPTPTPPVLAPPPIVVIPPVLPPLLPPTESPDPIFGGSSQALGWTWHLSVVNAGHPRQIETDVAVLDRQTQMQMVASRMNATSWQHSKMDNAEWKLIDDDQQSEDIRRFIFGNEEGIPVAGDWDGDGRTEIGVFIAGYWYLDLNGNGRWDSGDLWAQLGSEADLPVTGDWDGDGKTDIGIFGPAWPRDPHAIAREPGLPDAENYPTRVFTTHDAHGQALASNSIRPLQKNMPPVIEDATSGARLLRKTMRGEGRADVIDHVFHYGVPGDTPIAGDWNGDGIRTIGVFRNGAWQLDTNGDGRIDDGDESYTFGVAGDRPASGDWNGDGIDDLGVFRGGQWLVDTNGNRELDALDTVFELGSAGDEPIVGDWDGDGVDEPGAYAPHQPAEEIRVSRKAG